MKLREAFRELRWVVYGRRGYLAKLRRNIADPAEAEIRGCGRCGYLFARRAWPACDGDPKFDAAAKNVFLDALTVLEQRTGLPAYGYWMHGCPEGGPPPGWVAWRDSGPWELWQVASRALVAEGEPEDLMAWPGNAHACASEETRQ